MEAVQFFIDGVQNIGDPAALWGAFATYGDWAFWAWFAGYLAPCTLTACIGYLVGKRTARKFLG